MFSSVQINFSQGKDTTLNVSIVSSHNAWPVYQVKLLVQLLPWLKPKTKTTNFTA